MKYKLIALDLDGTLLNSQQIVDDDTEKIIKKCINMGLKVVLSTGRLKLSASKIAEKLDIKNEIITLNGAVIANLKDKKVTYLNYLKSDKYKRLIPKLSMLNIPYLIYDSDTYYSDKRWEIMDLIENVEKHKCNIVNDLCYIEKPVKAVILHDKNYDSKRLKEFLGDKGLKVVKTSEYSHEVLDEGVSKKNGLEYICKLYGIDRSEVMAVGDSENDIEMLQFAGLSVAMGNAFDHIKEIAHDVTDTNDNKGVFKAIQKHIFGKN